MTDPAPPNEKLPWYQKKSALLVAFLCVGPLMLPMVWLHPKMETTRKLLWTVVIFIVTYFLVVWSMDSLKKIGDLYGQMSATLP